MPFILASTIQPFVMLGFAWDVGREGAYQASETCFSPEEVFACTRKELIRNGMPTIEVGR